MTGLAFSGTITWIAPLVTRRYAMAPGQASLTAGLAVMAERVNADETAGLGDYATARSSLLGGLIQTAVGLSGG